MFIILSLDHVGGMVLLYREFCYQVHHSLADRTLQIMGVPPHCVKSTYTDLVLLMFCYLFAYYLLKLNAFIYPCGHFTHTTRQPLHWGGSCGLGVPCSPPSIHTSTIEPPSSDHFLIAKALSVMSTTIDVSWSFNSSKVSLSSGFQLCS